MSNKRFKSLNGYWKNLSPVKEGRKNHNFAEGTLQTSSDNEEKVLFFFEKPNKSSAVYEHALAAHREKKPIIVSNLTEDDEGKYLACRTSNIKEKSVSFSRRESSEEQSYSTTTAATTENSLSHDDLITISGNVVKLNEEVFIQKYDQNKQTKVDKVYRTAILANDKEAFLVLLWENLSNEIKEDTNVILRHMRRCLDFNNITYFSSTFNTEWSESTVTFDDFDEDSIEKLADIQISLYKHAICTIESVVVDTRSTCPRCKSKSNDTTKLITCANDSCRATFKINSNSIRADLTVREIDTNAQYSLAAYNDILIQLDRNLDKAKIVKVLMENDDRFELSYHYQSKTIQSIKRMK